MTPFRLMYGREAVLPTDELLFPPKDHNATFVGTYIDEVTERMSSAWTVMDTCPAEHCQGPN